MGPSRRILSFGVLSVIPLALGCGSFFTPTTTGYSNTPAASVIYVIQNDLGTGSSRIIEFPANGQGSITPTATLAAPANYVMKALAVDSAGYLYIAEETGLASEILVYGPGSTAASSPVRTITNKQPLNIFSLAVDSTGQIYELGQDANRAGEINVFSAEATGPATPVRQIAGSSTLLADSWSIAVDGGQSIYVANANGASPLGEDSILVFPPTATGNASPAKIIAGSATGIGITSGLAVDEAGDAFVVTTSSGTGVTEVIKFAAGATGNAVPVWVLSTASSIWTQGVALDATGALYTVTASVVPPNELFAVDVFSPGASGTAPPAQTISSSAWTNSFYGQIAVH